MKLDTILPHNPTRHPVLDTGLGFSFRSSPRKPRPVSSTGRRLVLLFGGISGSLTLGAAALAQTADLAAIDTEVARFTGNPMGAPGGAAQPVDRRLRLRPCPGPLALEWYGLRRETVQVSCPLPGGWRIYVPLTAGSQPENVAPLVTKGDAVTVTVSGQGFAVSQQGEALEGGGAGEWIKVQLGRGEPLRARVLRPGAVGIVLP